MYIDLYLYCNQQSTLHGPTNPSDTRRSSLSPPRQAAPAAEAAELAAKTVFVSVYSCPTTPGKQTTSKNKWFKLENMMKTGCLIVRRTTHLSGAYALKSESHSLLEAFWCFWTPASPPASPGCAET